MSWVSALAASVLLLASACTDPPPPAGEQVTSFVSEGSYPMQFWAQTDVLFVVDTSVSFDASSAERAVLEQIGQLVNGDLPDIHVGVATSDLADAGRLREGRFLADALQFDLQRHRNYDGAFLDAALALLDAGTGATQPRLFEAAERALSDAVNPGFRREGPLYVVFVTGSDDLGTRSIDDVAATLAAQQVLAVGALVTCDAVTPRLDALVARLGMRKTLCDADVTSLGDLASAGFKETLEGRCLGARLADVDPSVPGIQHECSAWLRDPVTGDERIFPECSAEHATDCWSVSDSPYQGCDPGYGLTFTPRRYPFLAYADIACVSEPQ